MPTFLLWNVQRKPLDVLVLSMVDRFAVDVVLLIEHGGALTSLPGWLAGVGFHECIGYDRFAVFARDGLSLNRLLVPGQHSRFDCWQIVASSGTDGLLGVVHGQDVRNSPGAETRAVLFRQLATTLEFHERRLGHSRTVVAGDFNADPFAPEVVGANGLHALGVRTVRGEFARRTNEQAVTFFYNPMWRKYGHESNAGAATYYYAGYDAVQHVWHMFDQVVTRPSEADRLPEDRIQIVREVGSLSLLDHRGNPDQAVASDHLPLLFFWNL